MIWKLVLFIYLFRKLIRVEISTSVRHQRPGMGGDYDQCYQGGPKRHRRREYPRDKLERGPRQVLAPWILNNGGYGACTLPNVVASGRGTVGAKTPWDFKKYEENTKIQCKLCGDKYPYNHMESHVIGVHGLDGPKEMYIDDQSSLVRSVSDTHDSKSIPRPLVVANHFPRIPMVPHIKKEADLGTQSFETYLLLSNQLLL